MIYTVTFSPSIDYVMNVPNFRTGAVNRVKDTAMHPGGKGINVSIVLKNLGIESILLGFTAGFTGEQIEKMLADFGCKTDFIHLAHGLSRINVKLTGGETTDINAVGPSISRININKLFEQLDKLSEGDILVLAGAIPPSMPKYTYQEIMAHLSGRGIDFVIDASGELLSNTLSFSPFLIKPNLTELEELFSTKLKSRDDIKKAAITLHNRGAKNVLVSLGAEGALLVPENGDILYSPVPNGVPINPVGAGDSMVAGFLYGFLTFGSIKEAFYYGIASGSASTYSESLASKEDIKMLRGLLN